MCRNECFRTEQEAEGLEVVMQPNLGPHPLLGLILTEAAGVGKWPVVVLLIHWFLML